MTSVALARGGGWLPKHYPDDDSVPHGRRLPAMSGWPADFALPVWLSVSEVWFELWADGCAAFRMCLKTCSYVGNVKHI